MRLGPVLIGIDGTHLGPESRRCLLHPAVGGVVLFTRNFEGKEQLRGLVGEIRALRHPRLLVCVDQEGGRVQRFRRDFTRLPALRRIGDLWPSDPVKAQDMAYRHGRVMATEMLEVGIDLSFAPVLDLDRGSEVIGDRSLGADPDAVISLGRAYLAGMHDAGMKTTGKHFPGHGSVHADSHVDDVSDDRDLEEIERSDMRPFADLAGELDALMVAHVVYARLDGLPAGYSPAWLKDVLRGRLAYRGVIFSDDLGMHAARIVGGLGNRARLALGAGCDLVLVCRPGDASVLLAEWGSYGERAGADGGGLIARLYGWPTLDREDLDQAELHGMGEWRQWQRSLEQLC